MGLLVWAFSCSYSNAQTTTTCTSTQYQSTDGTINPLTGDTCFDSANQTVVPMLDLLDLAKPGGITHRQTGTSESYLAYFDGYQIVWRYTGDTWSATQAVTQALVGAGLLVDGYTATFDYLNQETNTISGNCMAPKVNGVCIDTLTLTVKAYNSNGVQIYYDTYDYSQAVTNGWTVEQITSYAPTSLVPGVDIASVSVDFYGIDNGYWRGLYGPRVKNFVGSLIVSQDQCTVNPLYDPSCPGYAAAWATQQYNTQCSANPLYDPGCPGYTTANYNYQCSINPTGDPSCPDYYVEMCRKDPLYDAGCIGYDTAYFEQQCGLDPQYDTSCIGYIDLAGNDTNTTVLDPVVDDIVNNTDFTDTLTLSTVEPEVIDTVETQTFVDDTTVFDVPEETAATAAQDLEDSIEAEIAQLESEAGTGETVQEDDIEKEIAELESTASCNPEKDDNCTVEENTVEELAEVDTTENETGVAAAGESSTGETVQKDDIEKEIAALKKEAEAKEEAVLDPVQSKREKIKELVQLKGQSLAEQMSVAANIEVQVQLQNRLLAIIGFVPDWSKLNKNELDGGQLQAEANLKGGRIVDHQFARWFLNDAGFAALEDLQYNLGSN